MEFKPLSGMERNHSMSMESDSSADPKYEIAESESQASCYKDDTEKLPNSGLDTQRGASVRNLTNQTTALSDTRQFICHSPDDAVSFSMESEGNFPVTITIKRKN